ncbi:13062_t:CDS:2, partial [Dentiscutata erythropus]
ELCKTPTEAITTVYQQIFKSKTNFSGPEIMGYDTSNIVQEYLNNLLFRLGFAGHGFKSAFIYPYNKQRSIFFQENKVGYLRQFTGYQLFGLDY